MRRHRVVGAAAALLATCALAGCSLFDDKEPGPVTTRIPSEAPAGADLMCGMDPASVETAVGYPVDRVEGSLENGTCTLWPVEGTFLREWLLSARVIDATSQEATELRGAIEGTSDAGSTRPPDVSYEDVLGGAWRVDLGGDEATSHAGATSIVFAGDRAVILTSDATAEGRDGPADHLALSRQLAASLGLTLEPPR